MHFSAIEKKGEIKWVLGSGFHASFDLQNDQGMLKRSQQTLKQAKPHRLTSLLQGAAPLVCFGGCEGIAIDSSVPR